MQHTPPRDYFNAKKIIVKLDLFMQNLKKIGKEMPKIESKKQFLTSIKGHNTVLVLVEIYPSAIPRHYFSISTLIPSLKKIGIESENKFTHLQSQNTTAQYRL